MNQKWIANAFGKINLGFDVAGSPARGVTSLETGLCFIEWADRLEFVASARHSLTSNQPDFVPDESNPIIRAVQLLENETGLKDKFHITLQNKVPLNAGLGLNSSQAAATLRALNKIANLGLMQQELQELGREINDEVAFFLNNQPGIMTGNYSDFIASAIQPDAYIVTCYPGVESQIENLFDYLPAKNRPDFSIKDVLENEDMDEWDYLLVNDFEQVVFFENELVGNLKDQFYDFGAVYASMSGMGTSVFGLFHQEFVALEAYESLNLLGYSANLTRPKFKPDTGIYLSQ